MAGARKRDGLPHVVVVGGGFAGLAAVKTLSKVKPPVRVTLLEQHNYHLFQPLLYQLATGLVLPADIAHPVRGIVRRYKRTSVRMAGTRCGSRAATGRARRSPRRCRTSTPFSTTRTRTPPR